MFEKVLRSSGRSSAARVGPREKPWLYAIALNCLRDSARRSKVEHRALERVAAERASQDDAAAWGELEALEHRSQLQQALAALAVDEREALALRFGADLSVPEIARTLGVPLSTAEGRVYRGLRKLREALD